MPSASRNLRPDSPNFSTKESYGGGGVECAARVARDMAGDEVDVLLRERIEGDAVE